MRARLRGHTKGGWALESCSNNDSNPLPNPVGTKRDAFTIFRFQVSRGAKGFVRWVDKVICMISWFLIVALVLKQTGKKQATWLDEPCPPYIDSCLGIVGMVALPWVVM
jgi:hypothetical protein